jgi:hypothetical protein
MENLNSKNLRKRFLIGLLVACNALTFAQTPPPSTTVQTFHVLDNGPTSQDNILFRYITPTAVNQRILMPYPKYHKSSATPWVSQEFSTNAQYGVHRVVNLHEDRFVLGTQKVIGLPNTAKAVRVSIKLKADVEKDIFGWPAHAQCDIALAKPSFLAPVLSELLYLNYSQNHTLHCESEIFVPVDQMDRNVKHIEVTVPLESNDQGEPLMGVLLNFGIRNFIPGSTFGSGTVSTNLSDGRSRGIIEAVVYLVGWYE